ncbi:hypothetical protein ACIO52_21660 [Nocardia sp. NPDC087230]|jgi:hypothetical protein|uniref:hypothetical protein n=1 Tax=Nocardia sp. NPDC087230 TaxID=3364331 RepID=UPI00382159FE
MRVVDVVVGFPALFPIGLVLLAPDGTSDRAQSSTPFRRRSAQWAAAEPAVRRH